MQPTTPATTRFADMRETPLYSFAPQALQSFAPFSLDTPAITPVCLLMLRRLVRPGMAVRLLLLRNVRPVFRFS